MVPPARISPATVKHRIATGDRLLLVCASEDAEKCRALGVEGSHTLSELRSRPSLSKDAELIFYCG